MWPLPVRDLFFVGSASEKKLLSMGIKTIGNSTTISFDVTDAETAKKVLLSLAETVGRRLRKDDARIEVVAIGIRFYDLSYISHQGTLQSPTNITKEIHDAACRLFDELWDGTPIRHLGIHTGKVSRNSNNRQLSLFDDTDYEKLEKIDRAVDSIRERFGMDAIQRASFLKQDKVDHMNGGISREKRTVDYNSEKVI